MPKAAPIPVRREEILSVAEEIWPIAARHSIEEIARMANIILSFVDDPEIAIGGYAFVTHTKEPLYVESLAREGGIVRLIDQYGRLLNDPSSPSHYFATHPC